MHLFHQCMLCKLRIQVHTHTHSALCMGTVKCALETAFTTRGVQGKTVCVYVCVCVCVCVCVQHLGCFMPGLLTLGKPNVCIHGQHAYYPTQFCTEAQGVTQTRADAFLCASLCPAKPLHLCMCVCVCVGSQVTCTVSARRHREPTTQARSSGLVRQSTLTVT